MTDDTRRRTARRGRGHYRWVVMAAFAGIAAVACQEHLTAPAECPQACPGGRPVIRDTLLRALPSEDTSFGGYIIPGSGGGGVLVSDSLGLLDDRAYMRFLAFSDSVPLAADSNRNHAYSVDSVAISISVLAHDTTVHGMYLFVYRIPATTDSGQTFGAVDSLLIPANLLDSVAVSDTLRSQTIQLVYADSTLPRLQVPPADSGRIALGFRVRASARTGARLGGIGSGSLVPTITRFITVAGDTDTTTVHQTLVRAPEYTQFVERTSATADPDLLVVGGQTGSRALIRFPFPSYLKDSVILVRATLQLTPNDTIVGLPEDTTLVEATTILADFGAKSPRGATFASAPLQPGNADTVGVEVVTQMRSWQTANPAIPPAFMVNLSPEGSSFSLPRFRSTRSASGGPILRVTYQVPFNFEKP